ncbi:MAG TPA: hypothetical protein VJR29_00650 [bacterium]|nr:hypothetical protein [bacterium]
MTPPSSSQAPVCIETFRRIEPICEAPAEPCVTVHRLVEDPVTRSSYVAETRECLEVIRRIPNLDLFERFPRLRQRLEQLNRRHSNLRRSPAQPGSPRNQPTPPAGRPQGQDIPLHPPAAPHPQPSSGASLDGGPVGSALALAGALVGSVAGAAARGAARVLRALGR